MYYVEIDWSNVTSSAEVHSSPKLLDASIARHEIADLRAYIKNAEGKTLLVHDTMGHWNRILEWCSANLRRFLCPLLREQLSSLDAFSRYQVS